MIKITLKDIARETGYSISTVSRVLSNVGKNSNKARNDILLAAERLNYPAVRIKDVNHRAKKLNIALVTDFHEGEFYASFFNGFLRSAHSENIRLSLLSVTEPRREISTFMEELLKDDYYGGGILFIPELERDDYINLLEIIPDDFPMVSNALIENPPLSTITFDGYSGGHQAAEHLYECGFRNVGIVKGPPRKAESNFRYNGFSDYIEGKPDMKLLWEYTGDFEYNSGVCSFEALHKSDIKPEAVFVSNDLMAKAFADTAIAHHYRIPEDIAVLGYDNLPMCRQGKLPISSIHTDFEQLGAASIQTLKNRMKQDQYPHGILSFIPVSLVKRDSTVKTGEKSGVTSL